MIIYLTFAEFRPRVEIARHVVKCKYPFIAMQRVISNARFDSLFLIFRGISRRFPIRHLARNYT